MPDQGNDAETGLSSSMDEGELPEPEEQPGLDRIESLFVIDHPAA